MTRMHADEIDTDVALVRRLISSQFPQWSDRTVERAPFFGTDNATYRLGDDLAVRLPRREQNIAPLEKEMRWLPKLAPELPLEIPSPVARGVPGEGFPFPWAVYRWLDGEPAFRAELDHGPAVEDLAAFIRALQAVDANGGPAPGAHNVGRGQPLAKRDAMTRGWIASLKGRIDDEAVTAVWDAALAAPLWEREPVWIHGDLDPLNLLVVDRRLGGVIDFGCLGVGDPACDVMVAWKLFPSDERWAFREELAVDDATWVRARGWVASQAVGALAYYTDETHPPLVAQARRWLGEVLDDKR